MMRKQRNRERWRDVEDGEGEEEKENQGHRKRRKMEEMGGSNDQMEKNSSGQPDTRHGEERIDCPVAEEGAVEEEKGEENYADDPEWLEEMRRQEETLKKTLEGEGKESQWINMNQKFREHRERIEKEEKDREERINIAEKKTQSYELLRLCRGGVQGFQKFVDSTVFWCLHLHFYKKIKV